MNEMIDVLNDFMEPDNGGDDVDEGAMGWPNILMTCLQR